MRSRSLFVSLSIFAAGSWLAVAATQAKPAPSPAVRNLKLEPASITLEDGRDIQKVLVFGETEARTRIDLTSSAVLKSDSANVEIDPAGYIHARGKGQASV